MAEENKSIGKRIKDVRVSLGDNMDEFGKRFCPNATKGTISKWENGKYLPNNERLKKISELGNISLSYLLHGTLTFDDLSDEDKTRILSEQSDNLSKREKGSIENLRYFLDNPNSKSKSFRYTIYLLSAALRYAYINEKQPDEDPKLIRSLEYIIKILNDYTTSGEMTSNKTKEQVRENLIEHLSDILDNSKKETD